MSNLLPPLPEDLDHIALHLADLRDELRGARLFITGGTGFFGKWLLESLLCLNERHSLQLEAVVLTRRPDAVRMEAPHLASSPALQFHEGDIRTFSFPAGQFSHVIHAATPASAQLNQDDPGLMLDFIIQGTRRTLDFARQAKASRVLLTSSGAVYGRQPADVRHVGEDYDGAPNPLDIRSAYGEGKRAAELLCAIVHQRHGLAATIARGFAFVGPHLPLDAHFAIGNFLRDGLAGGPIRVAGDGTPYRSYLYAADLAIWLWTILLRGQPGRAYNVGSEEELSIAELAHKIGGYFGTPVEIARSPIPGKPVERYVPSAQRAREELGLKAWVPLDHAIDRTVRWHRRG